MATKEWADYLEDEELPVIPWIINRPVKETKKQPKNNTNPFSCLLTEDSEDDSDIDIEN